MAHKKLTAAKKAKNDEFYTQLSDIAKELTHYRDHFRGKVIFCNCDDPTWSNFWKYFHLNFAFFGLKKLIATHYDPANSTYKMEYEGGDDGNTDAGIITPLQKNGDFRSPECIELLREADIVVTNPMFSLFRPYIAQLIEYNKKFIIMGNMNAVTYKEFFPLLKDNKVWAGYSFNKSMLFAVPEGYDTSKNFGEDEFGRKLVKVPAICWFTNLDIKKRHEPIDLVEKYDPEKYPRYDNYEAIEVSKTLSIPCDYVPCWYSCPDAANCVYAKTEGREDNALCEQARNGEMGVPISFLDKHSPEQFEITRFRKGDDGHDLAFERERKFNRTSGSSFAERRKCNGLIGVPISFLDKYCPEQFNIFGFFNNYNPETADRELGQIYGTPTKVSSTKSLFRGPAVNGKAKYFRVLIRKV